MPPTPDPAELDRRSIPWGSGSLSTLTAPGPPDAVPAFLIHGFGANALAWIFVQGALARDRAVHALDLPSHGGSTIDAGASSLDAMAEAARTALDASAPGRVHLVGHSLGGRIALRVAAGLGARLASLTLMAPAGFGPANRAFVDAFVTAEDADALRAAFVDLIADPGLITPDMLAFTLAEKGRDGVARALRALAADALARAESGTRDELAAVDGPILAIWGEDDRILPADHAAALADRSRLLRLAGIGHVPQLECPERLTDALLAFWSGQG